MTAPEVRAFRPNRHFRREFSGTPCIVCGNRLHPADMAAITPADAVGLVRIKFLHPACLSLLTSEEDE